MSVKRTVRRSGGSLIITIPADIAALHDIQAGDSMEFMPMAAGELRIRKV